MNIDFREIELSDEPVIDHYLSMGHYENSEFSFSNMFIWRYAFNLRFTVIDDFYVLSAAWAIVFILYFLR